MEQEKGGKYQKWKIKTLARARRGGESGRIEMVLRLKIFGNTSDRDLY